MPVIARFASGDTIEKVSNIVTVTGKVKTAATTEYTTGVTINSAILRIIPFFADKNEEINGEARIIPRQDRKESCRLADAMEYGFATSSTVKAKNREVIPSGSRMAKKLAKTIIIIIAARETEGVNPTKEAYTTARSAHEIDLVRFDTPIRLNMP